MCKTSPSISIGHLGVWDSWLMNLSALTSGWRWPGGMSGSPVSVYRQARELLDLNILSGLVSVGNLQAITWVLVWTYHLQGSILFIWSCLHTLYAVQQWIITSLTQYDVVPIEIGVMVCQFFHAVPPSRMETLILENVGRKIRVFQSSISYRNTFKSKAHQHPCWCWIHPIDSGKLL